MVLSKIVVRAFVVSAVLTFLCTLPEQAQAFSINFNLLGSEGTAVDGLTAGPVTKAGLTVTLSANVGVLNQTGSGFGINSPGADVSDGIDKPSNVAEFVTIEFDQLVTFDQLKLSRFTSSDEAKLTIANFSTISLNNVGTTDIYNFLTDNIVSINQSVVLAYSSGNGFGFDEFTVTTSETSAVPEPATIVLLGIGLVGLGGGYLWRRREQ